MTTPTFNPQTNLWYRGSEVLIPFGGVDPSNPDKLYSLQKLKYYFVEGEEMSPFTFHAATDRFIASDQPHKDQLLNPAQIPTQATAISIELTTAVWTGFTTGRRPAPIEGAKPVPGSGSEGTEDPLGPTAIIFKDSNGDEGEYDAGALAWSMSVNSATYVKGQLSASLKEQGLK